jgi:hypothetical protein
VRVLSTPRNGGGHRSFSVQFNLKRRQQFLSEIHYSHDIAAIDSAIQEFSSSPAGSGDTELEGWMISRRSVAIYRLHRLCLQYTAGDDIAPLRMQLEQVVDDFARYGELLWQFKRDRNEPVFGFHFLDEYCDLLQILGLCFLLHRRDLLPRIAAFQDDEDGANGGTDTLYEEMLAYGIGPESRFETDQLCQMRPYENLFYALTETTPEKSLKELNLFLKRWYKDLAGTGWHDSHKPNEKGEQGSYFGYWSFEAGAAVLLLGIDDDSSLQQYLYYPKDLVAWARANKHLSEPDTTTQQVRLRCEAKQPCPREGFWFTPAQAGSRRFFRASEPMPEMGGDYGTTIWQWDPNQAAPRA